MIKKNILLYMLLIVAAVTQAIMLKHFRSFPDLIVLLVVFAAIFRGASEGLVFALVAGVLRGGLSAGTLYIDIMLFPFVALFASILSRMLFKHNFFVQVLVTFLSLVIVLVAQTLYLNAAHEGIAYVPAVIRYNLKLMIITSVISPVFFGMLSLLVREELQ